jgi:hypothetical protein
MNKDTYNIYMRYMHYNGQAWYKGTFRTVIRGSTSLGRLRSYNFWIYIHAYYNTSGDQLYVLRNIMAVRVGSLRAKP